MRSLIWCAVGSIALTNSAPVWAQIEDCSLALIRTTVNETTSEVKKLSLAYSLTDTEYYTARDSGGAEASYGLYDFGANYNGFRENIRQRAEELGIEDFQTYYTSYASSGLGDNALEAYQSCLAAKADGLSVVLKERGASHWFVRVFYTVGYQPSNVTGEVRSVVDGNIKDESIASAQDQMSNTVFDRKVDFIDALAPMDKMAEGAITYKVGTQAPTLRLPPLDPPKRIRIQVSAKMKYRSPMGDQKEEKINFITPDFAFRVPQSPIDGKITSLDVTVTQLINGEKCASGNMSFGAQNFPGTEQMNATWEFRPEFTGGMQSGAADYRFFKVYLYPKDPKLC